MLYLNSIIGKGEVALGLKILILGLSAVSIFICLGLILWCSACMLNSLKSSNLLVVLFGPVVNLSIVIVALGLTFYSFSNIINYSPEEVSRNASLTEVSDLITVDNDKVEIKSLTDKQSKYFYYDLENDKTQIFKIEEDTFYNRMYLIDQNNHKSQLSEDEMDMIKSKRNK